MTWLYLALIYLLLAAAIFAVTRRLSQSVVRASLLFFGGGVLLNLLSPSGVNLRVAFVFALGLALVGGWALLSSLLTYDDALQERLDQEAQEHEARLDTREAQEGTPGETPSVLEEPERPGPQ